MNTALWIAQWVLAGVFLMAGMMKLLQPKEALVEKGMKVLEGYSPQAVRTIGLLEVLGAVGVVLPALTGILPWLTPWAALGLALTMAAGSLAHLKRGEYAHTLMTGALLILAAFVAYGRF